MQLGMQAAARQLGMQGKPPGSKAGKRCMGADQQACRQAVRQADRHAGRQAGRQADLKAGRQAGR